MRQGALLPSAHESDVNSSVSMFMPPVKIEVSQTGTPSTPIYCVMQVQMTPNQIEDYELNLTKKDLEGIEEDLWHIYALRCLLLKLKTISASVKKKNPSLRSGILEVIRKSEGMISAIDPSGTSDRTDTFNSRRVRQDYFMDDTEYLSKIKKWPR